jgi:hypothetical protein
VADVSTCEARWDRDGDVWNPTDGEQTPCDTVLVGLRTA